MAEIARLEVLRDRALTEASGTRWFCTIVLSSFILAWPQQAPASIGFICALFVVCAWMFWRASFAEPGDLDPREKSDRYPTEDGSARTIQAKIDKLRRDAGPWG